MSVMTESDEKFEELIGQLEKLIMSTAPLLKQTIVALKNKEMNQGISDYEEIRKNEIELGILRKTYMQIINGLIELDRNKAKLRVTKIIRMRRQLDTNYIQDLKNANSGSWYGDFYEHG